MDLRERLLLYAVTDRSWVGEQTLLDQISSALVGGATCLQLREKELDKEEFLREAIAVKALCAPFGVPLIVNDSLDVALACGADGLHVGQSDVDALRAREALGPDKILGVSAQTADQARRAVDQGADYLGVGAVFATQTKRDADAVSLETLRAICDAVDVPIVAIGGITLDNMGALSGSGIAGIAVVSAIFGQPDVELSAMALLERARETFANETQR